MSQEILEKVCAIVSEQLSVEAGEVKSDSNFQNDLGADSLDTVELVMVKLFYNQLQQQSHTFIYFFFQLYWKKTSIY